MTKVGGGDYLFRAWRSGHPLARALALRIAAYCGEFDGANFLLREALRCDYLHEEAFHLWLQRARAGRDSDLLSELLERWLDVPHSW